MLSGSLVMRVKCHPDKADAIYQLAVVPSFNVFICGFLKGSDLTTSPFSKDTDWLHNTKICEKKKMKSEDFPRWTEGISERCSAWPQF